MNTRINRLLLQIVPLAIFMLPAIASAQFKSGPIRFHNQTDKPIRVYGVLLLSGNGNRQLPNVHWELAPGQRAYLAQDNVPVRATFFAFRVQNDEGTSQWYSEQSDFAANGDLVLEFGPREAAVHRQAIAANGAATTAPPVPASRPSGTPRHTTGRPRTCPICHGSGEKDWCGQCAGDGWYLNFNDLAFPEANGRSRCWKCGGDGREFCNHCSGSGVLR